ncbi:MAG: dTDP-4-amino-4,6-dideoxygalactose transaminase [Colwellia sp.]
MEFPLKYPIVKPYLPALSVYQNEVEGIFDRNYLTNNGALVQLLEKRLAEYLGVEHLLLVANGTLALNIAYAALNVEGEVLTTPFSFAATASSLCWQGLSPHFIDIDLATLNLDVTKITSLQAEVANAILPVHVFGNPCNHHLIEPFAKEHNLTVIYDAAHAFASRIAGQSILNFGDAATLSLHATKLFHCVEGGAVIFKSKTAFEKAKQLINFGFDKENVPQYVGINAKMSEFHAAMGLAVLDDIGKITKQRKLLVELYLQQLSMLTGVRLQQWYAGESACGAYMPIILASETILLTLMDFLKGKGIQTRRYFYPSLSKIKAYGEQGDTPIAEQIASRILCLPMYTTLTIQDVEYICQQVKQALVSNNK